MNQNISKLFNLCALLVFSAILIGIYGCGIQTLTYKKDFNILPPVVFDKNPKPIPTTLKIENPTLSSHKIAVMTNGKIGVYINLEADKLANEFKKCLYIAMKKSMLYQNTIKDIAYADTYHTIETMIKFHGVQSGWSVWSNTSTTVDVDYLIKSHRGHIMEKGTVTEEGNFDEGHVGLDAQEKLRFDIEPIQKALTKAAKSIAENLVSNRNFMENARLDILKNENLQDNYSRKTAQHSITTKTYANKRPKINTSPIKFRTQWAIIVGISTYQYSGKNGLNNLMFADDDAKAFSRSLLKLGWSNSHINILTNEKATRRNIMIALESWLTKAGPNDQIVLFWAGHGFPDPEDPEKVYFACYDTDIKIPATGYRMDRVRSILEERNTKNVIVFADTCHAGKLITRGQRGISILPNIEKMRREQSIPKGWIFMVGADTDRQAIEHTSWTNGAFTHSLIKGLSGAADGFQSSGIVDGIVTLGELRSYMNSAMPDETQKVLGVAKRPVITTSTGDPDIWNLTLQVK